jgi:hypothetical protein
MRRGRNVEVNKKSGGEEQDTEEEQRKGRKRRQKRSKGRGGRGDRREAKEGEEEETEEEQRKGREEGQSPIFFPSGLGMRCSTIGCSAFSSMQLAGDFVPIVIDNSYHHYYCYVCVS